MSIRLYDPLPGGILTDPFGWRGAIPSIGVPAQLHNGQDVAAPYSSPILAAHDGTVIWAGWDRVGGGNGVQLSTGQYSTLYFHMNEPAAVRVGQSVLAGDVIGYVGSTGAATGPHLHFMLRLPGGDVDPMPYLRATPDPDPDPGPAPDPQQKEDEDMSRPVCVATEVKDAEGGTGYMVRIFQLDSGEEHLYSWWDQKYITNVALTYGCSPELPVSYLTRSHWDGIGAQLAKTRDRLDARAA